MALSMARWVRIGLAATALLAPGPWHGAGAAEPPGAPAAGSAEPAGLAWPQVSELDPWAYREVVGWAHAAVKLIHRPMTAEQEAALDKQWAPAYAYACPAFVEWLQKLVPLLRDFLAQRGEASIVAPELDAAWKEALAYRTAGDAAGTEEALAVTWAKKQQLLFVLERMRVASEGVKALGDPPDVKGCRDRRRALHDGSVHAAVAPRPAWVLTGYEVEFSKSPHLGTFLAGCSRPDCFQDWTDTWRWEHGKQGSSVTSALTMDWKTGWWKTDYADGGRRTVQTRMTATGYARSRLRLVWEQVPRLVRHVPDRQVPSSTMARLRFRVEDLDRAEDTPFEDSHGLVAGPRSYRRDLEHAFSAALEAPDGHGFNRYGGYDSAPGGNRLSLTESPRVDAVLRVQFRFDAPWWGQEYQREVGAAPPAAWASRPAGTAWKMRAVLRVGNVMEGNAPMPGREEGTYEAARNDVEVVVRFEWTFDPTGGTVEPLDLAGEEDLYAATTQVLEPWEEARAQESAKARKEAIEFHRANVRLAVADRDHWRGLLWGEANPERREELLRRAMNAEHVRYCELDRIRELETGTFVHTRTPVDEWSSARFVQSVAERMDPANRIRRYAEGVQRVARRAVGGDRDRLAGWAARHMRAAEVWGDVEAMEKVSRVVLEEVQGGWEEIAAREQEKALVADQNLRYAQIAKTVAEAEMFVATAGASSWAMPAFEGAVGFAGAEGGLGNRLYEGLVSGLMWTNAGGMAAAQALEGYENGGWLTGEKGWIGAAERATETFAAVKGVELAIGRLFGSGAPRAADAKPTVQQAFEEARFRQSMEEGRVLVTDYERAYAQYQQALEHGASGAEAAALERGLREKATLIHSTYEAKLVLKSRAASGANPSLVADYQQRLAAVHRETEAGFRRLMAGRGYEGTQDFVMQEFRNGASAGTVGMDYDVGLVRRFVEGGSGRPGPAVEIPFTKHGLRVTPAQLQADASAAWEAAYRTTTGRSARRSFETLTTASHPEAYADLSWLGHRGPGLDPLAHVNLAGLEATRAGQAGDVTLFKGMEMLHNPDLGAVSGTIEASRGMAKDIKTKLLPLIEEAAARNPGQAARFRGYRDHWQQVMTALEGAPAAPSRASEQVRLLTGGSELPEVLLDLRDMISTYGRALGKR